MLYFNVFQLRGTIFISKFIGYSTSNSAWLKQLFPNTIECPIPQTTIQFSPGSLQITQQPQLEENAPWQLVEGNTRIVFNPNRIDIIRDVVTVQDSAEDNFCNFCSDAFLKIVESQSLVPTRLAYAPIYAKDRDDSFNSMMLWNNLLTHPSYGDIKPEEVSLTYNYRVEKSIGERSVPINFKTFISDAQKQLPTGIVSGCVTISLDINTAVNPVVNHAQSLEYGVHDIEFFFKTAYRWGKEFLSNNIN